MKWGEYLKQIGKKKDIKCCPDTRNCGCDLPQCETFKAWVVLDEYNRAISYLDESLGAELDRSKKNYERQNYKIILLKGVIE